MLGKVKTAYLPDRYDVRARLRPYGITILELRKRATDWISGLGLRACNVYGPAPPRLHSTIILPCGFSRKSIDQTSQKVLVAVARYNP